MKRKEGKLKNMYVSLTLTRVSCELQVGVPHLQASQLCSGASGMKIFGVLCDEKARAGKVMN